MNNDQDPEIIHPSDYQMRAIKDIMGLGGGHYRDPNREKIEKNHKKHVKKKSKMSKASRQRNRK